MWLVGIGTWKDGPQNGMVHWWPHMEWVGGWELTFLSRDPWPPGMVRWEHLKLAKRWWSMRQITNDIDVLSSICMTDFELNLMWGPTYNYKDYDGHHLASVWILCEYMLWQSQLSHTRIKLYERIYVIQKCAYIAHSWKLIFFLSKSMDQFT